MDSTSDKTANNAANDNVIDLDAYRARIADLIKAIAGNIATGEALDFRDIASLSEIDPNLDNSALREFVLKQGMAKAAEWDKLMHKRKVKAVLGECPSTASAFIALFVRHEGIAFGGGLFTQRVASATAEVARDDDYPAEDFERDARMMNHELRLGFRDGDIADAVSRWCGDQAKAGFAECCERIATRKVENADAMWRRLIEANFVTDDDDEQDVGLVVAVLKKFVWQVKRKLARLPVTNHLMPVLHGPQGCGKSTFMMALMSSVAAIATPVDFRMICDNRNIALWRYFVMTFDEMGFAEKQDSDELKHIISAETLNRRPMFTNRTVAVRQCATFIGCSNKELDQLIRDETGIRRFFPIYMLASPDWALTNATDWNVLWQSVDERGSDPTVPFIDALKIVQEAAKDLSSVAMWLEQFIGRDFNRWRPAGDLYDNYHEYEERRFPALKLDIKVWGKELNRIIKSEKLPPFIRRRTSQEKLYHWLPPTWRELSRGEIKVKCGEVIGTARER